ncbi:hypothetical protein GBAR_LOCUS19578, partial [Geodia barretti]
SLQEYLAAWHLAKSYSIEFQVAYHGLAVDKRASVEYKGDNKEEETLLSSLERLGQSLVEPAIFLAGITGLRCQSEDDRNHWKIYVSHDTANVKDLSVLIRSLYEAQNPNIISHYFAAEKSIVSRREVSINAPYYPNSSVTRTPYDTYAISYCLAHSSEEFSLFYMPGNSGVIHEVTLVETFVKGLEDHCSQSSMPRVRNVRMCLLYLSAKGSSIVLYWFKKAKFSPEIKEIYLEFHDNTSDDEEEFLKSIVKLQSLEIHIDSLRWIGALNNLRDLRVLRVFTSKECSLPPPEVCNWSEEYGLIGGNKLT